MEEGGRRVREDVKTEANVRAMWLLLLKIEQGRRPGNVGSLHKLEKSS